MNEADHKRKLVAEVNALRGGYACRIEDRFAVGRLDLIIKLPGHPVFFAEGKKIKGNLFGPTERQFLEGRRLEAADIPALLIGWKDKLMYVSPWTFEADLRQLCAGFSYITTLMEYLAPAWMKEAK